MNSFLAGLKDPLQYSEHVRRSLEAFMRGGWIGVGIGKSQTKLNGCPFLIPIAYLLWSGRRQDYWVQYASHLVSGVDVAWLGRLPKGTGRIGNAPGGWT